MKHKNILKIAICFFLISGFSYGQLSVTTTNTNFTISFDATVSGVNNGQINGTGFATSPSAGQLDGNAWRTTGFGNNQAFDASCNTADCGRGTSATSTSGGVYAFEVSTGDFAFGVTPAGSDFTPGDITLKVVNNTGATVTSMTVSYEVWVLNSQARSNSFNFAHSSDDSSYTNVTALDFTSTEASDAAGWVRTDRTTTITGLNLANGATYYLRWNGDDVGGGGSRDRFAVDDITVNMTAGAATPGITLTPVSGNTNESGTTATFTAVLNAQPTDDVVLNISSANTDEVTVSPATLTFTNANWETPQQITLTGADDVLFDGNQDITITVSVDDANSDDDYDAVADVTTTVTNEDNDVAPSIGFATTTSSETETDVTFTSANIAITVANYSGEQIDINVSVTGGTAEVGDYTFTTPTPLSFSANGTLNITVDINDDADTDNETIIFTITETSSVTGLVISQATHTLTISDDEAPAGPIAGTVFITEVLDSDNGFNNDYMELYNNSNIPLSLINSKLLRLSAAGVFEYAYDFGVDESTASADLVIPAYGFLIIARGATRADFNTANSITLDAGVNFNGGNTELFFGTGRRWQLVNGGTADTNDGTLVDDTLAGIGTTKDYRDIFTGAFITGTPSEGTPGALEYLVYNGGAWINSVAMDGTTGAVNAYIYDDLTLSSNAQINDLGVASGGSLTINSGVSLIVNGTSSGNVTYNRNLGTENWYLVSSPVAGETYDNAYIAANSLAINGSNNAIGSYTTADNTWSYMQTGGGATFTAGQGYSVRRATSAGAGNISFTGTINTSDVSVGVSNAGTGFNLLGNPFTSFINSATLLTDNGTNLVSTDIWVFNQ
ncbi:hypothetical protein IU405_01875, partial [Polaribacter sp. BAL334]|uniref:beta strand repeat-containing protein n=1 Tax=Polaribacter sp. BAL334 TaxID=1708178 RepID=UPI0018D25A49